MQHHDNTTEVRSQSDLAIWLFVKKGMVEQDGEVIKGVELVLLCLRLL